MAGRDGAAVGNGVEEALSPVPGGVEADGEPKCSGSAKGEAEEHPDDEHRADSERALVGVPQVDDGKVGGEDRRCQPEPSAAGKSEERIAAGEELFVECDDDEEHSPEDCEL